MFTRLMSLIVFSISPGEVRRHYLWHILGNPRENNVPNEHNHIEQCGSFSLGQVRFQGSALRVHSHLMSRRISATTVAQTPKLELGLRVTRSRHFGVLRWGLTEPLQSIMLSKCWGWNHCMQSAWRMSTTIMDIKGMLCIYLAQRFRKIGR